MVDARLVPLALIALFGASCGSGGEADPPAASAKHDLAVMLTAHVKPGANNKTSGIGRQNDTPGAQCGTSSFTKPTDALAFMKPDNETLLKDEHGTTISKGSFETGTMSNLQPTNEFDCTWRLEFKDVPASSFYDLSVAGHQVVNMTQAEVQAADWVVPVSINP